MKYDAVSFVPHRGFSAELGTNEFETNNYCLDLRGGITLHLKAQYLEVLLGDTPPEKKQIRRWYFYTTHLNGLYLLLDSLVFSERRYAYFELEEITTQNINVVSESGVSPSSRSHLKMMTTHGVQEFVVSKEILERVEHYFSDSLKEFEHIYVLGEAAKSLAAFKSGDFSTSFVLNWFLLERFIARMWSAYLESENHDVAEGQKRISSDRKQSLNDSRSFPVSVKLHVLELAGRLSFNRFSDLDILRRKRNEIVHPSKGYAGNPIVHGDYDTCAKAFELLQGFLQSDLGIPLVFNSTLSYPGVYNR
jgi:hypothetical protein